MQIYAFGEDEFLEKVIVKSEEHIFGIQLRTNTHTYGELSSSSASVSSFSLPEYHSGLIYQSVAYFTGYAQTKWSQDTGDKKYEYVSGLQIHHHYANCQGTLASLYLFLYFCCCAEILET